MADPVFAIFDPLAYVTGGGVFILVGLAVSLVIFKDKLRQIIFVNILKRYPLQCFIFELKANIPIPVCLMGAIKLPQEDGNYDVLRLSNGDKVRVFGYSDMYSTKGTGKPILFLLKIGAYEYHIVNIQLSERVVLPERDRNGKVITEIIETNKQNSDGSPVMDANGRPVLERVEVPKIKEIQTIMFSPRIDEDAMAWVVREMRRAEMRRRDKSVWGVVFPLIAPLLLAIGLMLLLKGTLDPLVQLATQLGPDLRMLAAALNNVQIIAAGPRPLI